MNTVFCLSVWDISHTDFQWIIFSVGGISTQIVNYMNLIGELSGGGGLGGGEGGEQEASLCTFDPFFGQHTSGGLNVQRGVCYRF